MKRILVPTDFSEFANNALQVATQLAKKHNAKLYLLHMMGMSQSFMNKDDNNAGAEAIYYLQTVKSRFNDVISQDEFDGIEVEEIVQNYKIFSEVSEIALEHEIDLIVMGSHGTGSMNDYFVGSNTEKVVRNSKIPVLVIKEERPEFTYDNIVFALDFNEESVEVYKRGMKFFEAMGSKVHLLYVNIPNQSFMSTTEMEEKVKKFLLIAEDGNLDKMENVNYFCDYTIENGIYEFSNKVGADIIALPTHGRKGLSHFFMGSIGEDIANHASLPVITFKI